MKNSILFVSGLWAFSVLVGKSCPSVIYSFNTDDSNDGAISAKNSNTLDLPRDMSQPIIARFARDIKGEDPSTSPKFNLFILIIPCVLGVVVIIIIVLVVCYMRRQSGRGTCISNEWLIWCGLMKRGNPSPVPDHSSADASGAPYVRREVTDKTGQSRMSPTRDDNESAYGLLTDSQRLQTPEWVERGEPPVACPSERSPSFAGTPNTGDSLLPPTDDELDLSPRTTAAVHHSGTKFRYPNLVGGHHGSITVEQSRATHRANPLDNITENEIIDDGRACTNNGKADNGMDEIRHCNGRSSSDDDVFNLGGDGVSDTGSEDVGPRISSSNPGRKRKGAYASSDRSNLKQSQILVNNSLNGSVSVVSHHVEGNEREMERLLPNEPNYANGSFLGDTRPEESHGDHSSKKWQRESPSSAPPGNTHQEMSGKNVYVTVHGDAQFGFHGPVETVQVGNSEINNNLLPHDVPDSRHNTCAFNRSSNVRQTR